MITDKGKVIFGVHAKKRNILELILSYYWTDGHLWATYFSLKNDLSYFVHILFRLIIDI